MGNGHAQSTATKSTERELLHVERENRTNIVIHKRPIQTIYYFFRELPFLLVTIVQNLLRYRKTGLFITICGLAFLCLEYWEADGPHSAVSDGKFIAKLGILIIQL